MLHPPPVLRDPNPILWFHPAVGLLLSASAGPSTKTTFGGVKLFFWSNGALRYGAVVLLSAVLLVPPEMPDRVPAYLFGKYC